MVACVEIRAAGKTYSSARGPVVALADVSMDVAEGEFFSLLGPSGCGKSTLLKCIAGLEGTSTGAIRVRGQGLAGPPKGLGMVFQRDVLLDWRTILENVLITAEFQGLPKAEMTVRARALLERFGLGAFQDRHPWELSGGMRQRASICRALLCEPEILLMDEPFGALDAMTRDDLNVELTRIWQSARRTVVFVTHSIAEAVFLSDRVAMMSPGPGRIVEIVPIDLPRPRLLSIRETPEFARHVAHIRGLFAALGIVKE
ncbi:NitT/TauT family transport system ATP-binding protein [Stella humosa]|uniref:NitT/TauT family transport system ATP-binding protein n=1 Tax=Stella humosa TaxID=94 RepID=A0A3N1KV35_9PROT|nr:ABC transporter ATP-binding protein [Stella humosa]ROP83342.1 NitT/TauT family transport system ATP-binding protein [Stella humosa]BBK29874.1 ABC transporter ATP-binding protein [Stella humosa]